MRPRPLHALLAIVLLWGTALAVVAPVTATAATSATCTIRGTARADVLVGTSRRDVICGLGGADVIRGRGGDDFLKGGAGADRLVGGTGADVVLSGGGADRVYGGDGTDRVRGGAMADMLDGGDGADLLYGELGADRISGGLGGDRVAGQAGADVLTGAGGTDTLLGGDGNDDLDGGPQADTLDGGAGTNWCTVAAEDVQHRCVYDLARPEALEVTTSATQVDVTDADREVTVRIHVTDDTGAKFVRVSPTEQFGDFPVAGALLDSGTARDGWWKATLVFRRWSLPGTYRFSTKVVDRVGRDSYAQFEEPVIEVRDDTPDTELPRVTELMSPTPDTTVDVRTEYSSVLVKARLTDVLSGVSDAQACIHEPLIDGREIALYCTTMRRRSGDIHDGVWSADVGVDRGAVSGDWNVEISTTDRAHDETWTSISWLGPDLWMWAGGADPATKQPLPDERGRFTVLGRPRMDDSTPPDIVSAVPSPTEVDTLAGPVAVDFAVRATDTSGSGVRGVGVGLVSADPNGPKDIYESLTMTSGNALDGTWTDSIVLPQGTPPGTYYLEVVTWDEVDNLQTYVSAGHPEMGSYDPLPGDPTVTVVDSTP